jgi:membrane peptidoglycan carboxypeptidase
VRLAAEKTKRPAELAPPPTAPTAIILMLEPHKYSVAVWIGDQNGQPVYSIVHENIREAAVAATLAREAARNVAKRLR